MNFLNNYLPTSFFTLGGVSSSLAISPSEPEEQLPNEELHVNASNTPPDETPMESEQANQDLSDLELNTSVEKTTSLREKWREEMANL